MPCPPYQPPLTRWSQAWRVLVAALLGLFFWAVAYAPVQSPGRQVLDLGLGLGALGVMLLRRRHPVLVTLGLSAVGIVSTSALGATMVCVVSLATRRRWREIGPLVAAGIGFGMVMNHWNPAVGGGRSWWAALLTNVVFAVAHVAVGLYIGSRRELLWTLRDQVARAEREQGLRIGQARSTERARIAREMHDVLAHRISLVSMHAGALAYRTDLSTEEVRDSAGVIRDAANKALEDLRDVLGVLREEPLGTGPPQALRPQPTLADLEDLVGQTRAAGTRVSVDHNLPLDTLPVATQRTAYRIVQEGLTNARKHSPHSPVSLSLQGRPGQGVRIAVRNRTAMGARPAPTSGFGLVGLGERAELGGGWLRTAYEAEDFLLEAWLPWAVKEPAAVSTS